MYPPHTYHRMPRRASVFCVSPPGIHISLVICVWGYTYHGDTHITVTPVFNLLRAALPSSCALLWTMADALRKAFAVFAVFLVFCPVQTSSTASPGLLSKNYAQIAQHFGFPFSKLPNISFANVGKECRETVKKLRTSKLAYPCEYFLMYIL